MTPEALNEALALAEAAASVREAAAALRSRFAPMRVVVVDAADMRGEVPAACGATKNMYFGASDGHCWAMTTDATQATGLFIAERA
jgi:hypothetical protein